MPTIGVSVAVPEPWGSELQDYRIALGDDSARHIPTHITLLPPHEVPDRDFDAVLEHLSAVAAATAPFRVHLRGTGTFRPVSPVVFFQVARGIAQCERLESAVRSGPLRQDLRFNYHPHVTVAHEVDDDALDRAFAEMAHYEAQFTVDAFASYEHGDDGVWRPVRDYPLDGGRPTDR